MPEYDRDDRRFVYFPRMPLVVLVLIGFAMWGAIELGQWILDRPHHTAEGAAAISKPFLASGRHEVYHRADCRHAQRISDRNRLGYDTAAAAESDGRRLCKICSSAAAAEAAEMDRIEIKLGLLRDLRASFADRLAALGALRQSHKIFLSTGLADFAPRADGVLIGTWPMDLLAASTGEQVKLQPVWTRGAAEGGVWRPANAAAEAINSGRLAAALAATGRLAAARALLGSEVATP